MIPILMEDWVTIRGNGVTVIQDAAKWLNSGPYQDIFFSLDVREVSGTVTFFFDTAPNRDEALFQSMVNATGSGFTPIVGLNAKPVRANDPSTAVPISQWTRWRITFGASLSDITFRVLANGNRSAERKTKMFGYTLQDWTTIRGQSSSASVIQNESDWLGFSSFQDMVFWIDLREATISTNITLAITTSPSKDNALFQTMVSETFTAASFMPGLVTPLPKVILASGPSVPLATWVRWELSATGASAWDLTFRILLSANRVWK